MCLFACLFVCCVFVWVRWCLIDRLCVRVFVWLCACLVVDVCASLCVCLFACVVVCYCFLNLCLVV